MKLNRRGIIVHPEELTKGWIDRMAKAGLNTLGVHPVGGKAANETLQKAIDVHTLPQTRALYTHANALGINVEYEAHVMSWLLPRHLFSCHADWFRMNEKGERIADFNLCASNTDALAYVAERTALLASLLETGTHKHYYWLDDVSGYKCSCPECQKLNASEQQLKIINAMLSGLKKHDKSAKLCFLAYHDAMEVPRKIEPLDGVFLEYAPIHRDHHASICDPTNEKNVAESASLKDLIQYFGTQDSRILDYWMDNSLFSNWTKPPKPFKLDEAVMRQDVQFYQKLGFEEITCFGCYLGADYEELYGEVPLEDYGRIFREIQEA